MQKLRPFLTALLGLTLWVQGLAIAAAPGAMAAQAADTASAASEMPCHGDEPAATVSPCACCDGDCANMTGCAVGSFVGAAALRVPADPPAHATVAAHTWSAKTVVSPLPLRPPISSHA
jgi:hypothetical protein